VSFSVNHLNLGDSLKGLGLVSDVKTILSVVLHTSSVVLSLLGLRLHWKCKKVWCFCFTFKIEVLDMLCLLVAKNQVLYLHAKVRKIISLTLGVRHI